MVLMIVNNNRYDSWFVVNSEAKTENKNQESSVQIFSHKELNPIDLSLSSEIIGQSEKEIAATAAFLSIDKSVVAGLKNHPEGQRILDSMICKRSQDDSNSFDITPDIQQKINNLFQDFKNESCHSLFTAMYKIVVLYKLLPQIHSSDFHLFRRSELGFPISILSTPDGKHYGIFKESVIARGGCKILVNAVDLENLKVFAFTKLKCKKYNLEMFEIYKQEIYFMKYFDTEEFVKLVHSFLFTSKDGNEIKFGILTDKADCDLYDYINKFSHLRYPEQLAFLKNLLKPLAEIHSENVMHRDIKLSNFVVENNVPKLIDFGWALKLKKEVELGHPGVGTIDYLAPELIRGNSDYNEAAKTHHKAANDLMIYNFLLKGIEKERRNLKIKEKLSIKTSDAAKAIKREFVLNKKRFLYVKAKIEQASLDLSKSSEEMKKAQAIGKSYAADMWALGLCIYALRNKGLVPLSSQIPNFLDIVANLTQTDIINWFDNFRNDPLQLLNLKMLALNPADRITAVEAIKEIEKIESALQEFHQ